MLNAQLKKELIENGTSDKYRKTRSEMSNYNALHYCEMAKKDDTIARIIFDTTPEKVVECERIRNNALRQRKKIEEHIGFLIEGNWSLFFLTLTFSDECLSSTTFETRRTTVRRLLSSFCDDFILNVDYGKSTDREHYHAIVSIVNGCARMTDDGKGHTIIDRLEEGYRYGFYKAEEIRTDSRDAARLSRYITKLTMHSVKVRQSYVSVKKDSPYQRFKKLKEEKHREARSPERRFRSDYETKKVWLLSGYAD